MTASRETTEARLDDLRKRLYRADATEEDRQRYLLQVAVAPEAPAPVPLPHRRRRPLVAIGLGIVLVAALAVAVRVGTPVARPPAAAVSATAAAPAAVLVDVGGGVLLPLGSGRPSGPTAVAASVDGMAVAGQRFTGSGNAVVAFDVPQGAWDGGRVSVEVSSAQPARVAWRALRTVTRPDWTSYPIVVGSGTAEDRSGAHAAAVVTYPKRPPTRIAIEAPEDVGWTLVVAPTGTKAAAFR